MWPVGAMNLPANSPHDPPSGARKSVLRAKPIEVLKLESSVQVQKPVTGGPRYSS